jgi:hypothetical protein
LRLRRVNRLARFLPNQEPELFERGLPCNQINNGPVFFALLEMIQPQRHGIVPPQSTGEQQCKQGSIAFSFHALTIERLPKRMALLWR